MYVSNEWSDALVYMRWLNGMGLEETHNIIVNPFNWYYVGDDYLPTEEFQAIVKNRKRADVFCRG